MQDYLDSTSNVIEAAISPNKVADDDKGHYSTGRRRHCKLLLLLAGFFVSSLDVATDWYNYADSLSQPWAGATEEGSDNTTGTFLGVFLGICVCGSLAWIATLFALVLQFHAVCRKRERSAILEFFEEMTSMTTLTLQDTPMVALLTASVCVRFCPLVEQMRTIPGQVALLATGVSLVWRMVHSLAFCCSCRKKQDQERTRRALVMVPTVILRVLRTVLLAMAAMLFLFTVVISFSPDPNRLGWLRSVLDYMDVSGTPNGPIYIYQKYDLPYTVRRHVDKERSGHVLSPAEEFEDWSDRKWRGVAQVDYNCDHYVRRIYVTDSLELKKKGREGVTMMYDCEETNPFFKTSLPENLQSLLENHTCNVIFNLVYDHDSVTLSFKTQIVLTSANATESSSPCVHKSLEETSHTGAVIHAWPSKVITSLKDYECEHSYECRTHMPPIFDVRHKPYFSCLSEVCKTSTLPVARDDDLYDWLHQFHYTNYQLVLPYTRAYFPCLLNRSTERELITGTCAGDLSSQAKTLSTIPTEVLSCPESPFPRKT